MKNGGDAFPISRAHFCPEGKMLNVDWTPGMTLLDYFAGQSLNHPYSQGDDTYLDAGKAAAWAYELAFAMIAEKERLEELA